MKLSKKRGGFTLIEILVVMVIIGILSTIGMGALTSSQIKSRDAKRKADLRHISEALEAYYNDVGSYPAGADAITFNTDLVAGDGFIHSAGTIYMVNLPIDPGKVNTNYIYYTDANGTFFQLYALLENTEDRDVPESGGTPQTYQNTDCGGSTPNCNFGITSSNTNVEANGHPAS